MSTIAFDQLTVEDRTVLAQSSGMLPVFEDPISMEIMEKAMMTPCGHSFSEESITMWLHTNKHCPLCNKTLKRNEVLPNYALRTAIARFITAQKHLQQNIQAASGTSSECGSPAPNQLNLEDWKVIRVEHNEFEGELPTDSKLLVELISAREIKGDWFGSANPYCTIEFDSQKKKSKVVHRTRNPKWEETFVFNIPNLHSEGNIVVTLWNKDRIMKDRFLGIVLIPITEVVTTLKMVRRFPLQKKRPNSRKKVRGDVLIRAQFLDLRKSYEMARSESSSITAVVSSSTPPSLAAMRHAFSAPLSHPNQQLPSPASAVQPPASAPVPRHSVQVDQQDSQEQAINEQEPDIQEERQMAAQDDDVYDEQPLSYYRLRQLQQLQQSHNSDHEPQAIPRPLPPPPLPSSLRILSDGDSSSSSSDYEGADERRVAIQPPSSPYPSRRGPPTSSTFGDDRQSSTMAMPAAQEIYEIESRGEEAVMQDEYDTKLMHNDGADVVASVEEVEDHDMQASIDQPEEDKLWEMSASLVDTQHEIAVLDVDEQHLEQPMYDKEGELEYGQGADEPREVYNNYEDDGEVEEILHQRRNRRNTPQSESRIESALDLLRRVEEANNEQGGAPQSLAVPPSPLMMDRMSPFGLFAQISPPPPPSDLVLYADSSRPQFLDVVADEDNIKFLTEMGFQAHMVQFALKYCDNDVEATLDKLLHHSDKLQLAFLKSSFYS